MRRLFASFAILLSLVAGAFVATPVSAQVDTGLSEIGQTVKLSSADPRVIAANIINITLGLVGIVLVSLMVYAGFLWMTSGGDEEKVRRAKGIITSAIIGLIIVLSSWAIARFVIERLLQATQGGGGGTTQGVGGPGGGGFGGGGASNVFQVSSITPQGSVPIRNVQVKMLFSRPVDDKTATAIVVTKNGGAAVAGTLNVNSSVVTFTPNDPCPSPNQNLFCFDADSDYTVQIGASLRSAQGQSIVCGGFAPACTATFHTGALIDTQNPTASIIEPIDGQAVPADSLVLVRGMASDDSGVAYIEFTDNGNAIGQSAPTASTTPQSFEGQVEWDTAGIPLQSIRQLVARAFDLDAHQSQSASVSVIVRSPSCFNGVKDGDETDIDCGGTPNTPGYCGACSGGSCSSNVQCSSGVCQNGTCVVQPTILSVSPLDGQPGTFVTLQGLNFGASGEVVFLGGAGPADDVVAQAPAACIQAGVTGWSPSQVIVAVPTGAASGPIRITNGQSTLSDATNDARGPSITDFLVNNQAHPGLCALNPSSGLVGDAFSAIGQGFGASPDTLSFGPTVISSVASWTDGQVTANVPVIGTGSHDVRVSAGGETSNPVTFTVNSKSSAGPPNVASIDPSSGPKEEYVTLTGANFGFSVGTVRFKNVQSGQEALGDTAFPAACSEGYWKETSVVVKVPTNFIVQGAVAPGDYAVRLIRNDGAESNEVTFTVTAGTAKPGICAISPSVGPVGTIVTLTGERFTSQTGSVTFQSSISAIPDSWTNTAIASKVPTGAVTGPVRVTAQAQVSNAVNFEVRNCNEQPGICSQNEQCCGNGTCISKNQVCAAASQSAMFAWQSSTGLIPVAPRVVEECTPDAAQPPIPSPAPWDKRAGGDQACVTASITMRFTTKLEASSVTASNFRIKKCTSASTEPCTTTTDVPVKSGFPLLQPASQNQDAVLLEGASDLDPSMTYLVEVLTGIKGFGPGGANMEPSSACGNGVGYCFRFKTRASTAPCAVGAVSVAPHPYELNDAGAMVNYLASPLSVEDKCVVLKCDAYDWEWQNGELNNPDGRAVFQQPLKPGVLPGSISCQQVGVAVSETGNVPVHMNATVKPDNVKGTGDLYVKFVPPRVVDHGPDCNQACVNALTWATFNVALDPASIAGNVEIRPCANENCVESELGSPLPIATDPNQLTTVPKTSEIIKRFLQIKAVDSNGALLFIPGAYYRVLLKGGTDTGIRGLNGVPMTGLNHPDGFVWTFRTKIGNEAFCTAQSVDVAPGEKYETKEGARQIFKATPFGSPDECSAEGQMLIQTEDANWTTSDPLVAEYFKSGVIDTGGALPAQCNAMCLAMGSQAVFGKAAVCGNGIIETTDAAYCTAYNAKNGGSACAVLPAGARDGEQCDPGVPSNVGLCDASTCLWKPAAQVGQPQGTCGNTTIELGEMCDFGSFCIGATSTADMTPCNTAADKAACTADGGTCAPRPYRGCSAFCRHTGAASGNSTCGNSDVADGEDCDDGNLNSSDGCSSACLHTGSSASVASVCGNAILESGEACEKGNVNDPQFPPGCDAKTCLHTGTGLCDNDPNTPNVSCCGNGGIDAGEDCDDGNKEAGDGCGLTCVLEGSSAAYTDPSFCSDGILETGEQCEVSLPSSHPSLLTDPKNAAPPVPPPIGVPGGDGVTDAVQLAYIVGAATPDQNGLMSSKLGATLQGKTGEATYGLQCGFTSESSCGPGFGLTDQGCCSKRPAIVESYPPHGSNNVCRNVEISAVFNTAMEPQSVTGNFQVAKQELGQSCPAGTTQIADDFRPIRHGILPWVSRLWTRFVAWATGRPAYAAIWCAGSVTGTLQPVAGDPTSFTFDLTNALASNTMYRIKFLGDDSDPNDPLADNADLSKKKGVKTSKGVVTPYDGASDAGPLTWSFTTGDEICQVNVVKVTDHDPDHPLLFVKNAETHPFSAEPQSLQSGVPVPLSSVAEYDWTWDPWTTSDGTVVQIAPPNPGADAAQVTAQNKNGNVFVVAWLKITADTLNVPSTAGKAIQGTAPVTVQLCENPWPSLAGPGPIAPFRDKIPTGDGSDSSLSGTLFQNGPFFNFSTTYCRDSGASGTSDDVPALQINYVPPTSVDASEGILRQYLFTFGSTSPELQKDGIGIRVVANPLHLSPEDWYAWRGFGGSPRPVMVDGYRALKDGTTTYVGAANTQDPGERIFSNIYLISHNPDASPVTVGIYEQMLASLTFNINLTSDVSNVCVQGNDPNVYGAGQFLVDGKTVACSADADCLKYANDTHCGSFKLKLARDTVRISDFQTLASKAESYRNAHGTYPKLEAGTFLQGFSTSRWESWSGALTQALGGTLVTDPVNTFLTCGRCSQSQAVCSQDSDCPSGQTCAAQQVGSATYDPQSCWDAVQHTYLCPKVGVSPSRIYQYRSLNGGQRYEISSEFEIPRPPQPNGKWWTPLLTTEVMRCTNADTLGFLCDVDADCRPCPNPKDPVSCPEPQIPVIAGACKPVGARFIYQDSCTNVPYGQGGTCGDGVIGSICVGGQNAGKGCTQDTDCVGGSCSGTELCEIGQTKIADCKTAPNLPSNDGLKVQTCNECKEFVDQVGLSQCNAGLMCGNGRVDKKCIGGPRNNLACLTGADCPSDPNQPPAICGPTSEICDDGSLNGTYGHCNLTCTGYASYCGDSMLSPGELCDNGPQNGTYCSGNCASSCSLDCKGKAPTCGDGIVDAPNEMCDGQTLTTVLGICTAGTGVDQPCSTDADCGQGGTCASSGVLASCQGVTIKKCASSLKLCLNPNQTYQPAGFDPSGFIVCQEDADCSGGLTCRSVQDALASCTANSQCSVSGIPGTCESYPTAHVRSCSPTGPDKCTYPMLPATGSSWSECKAQNFCGDGIVNGAAEQCDDGASNGDTKACTSTCKKNVCGDGKVFLNVEQCDNGAQNGSITCNADYGSTCASCSSQCKFLTTSGGYCGDQVKNGPEQCDGLTDIVNVADQVACPGPGMPVQVCPYLNADCTQSPCRKTKESGVTCKSLGYDFATNGMRPKLKLLLDPATTDLDETISSPFNVCPGTNGMKEYAWKMYQECLGAHCVADPLQPLSQSIVFANPLPSSNDFWKCVKEKGPPLGIGIQTDPSPELVQCNNSCGFSGCGRCSDEVGTGSITATVVDAVYNQVVPFAKVSLFYKGVVVTQTSTDADGAFTVTGLNDRPECSQYKLVIDKYDDNPCTGSQAGRPNCGLPAAPDWPYPYNVPEDQRGGYWPLTTPMFSTADFTQKVGSQGQNRIYLFPRPGIGEAYMSVFWDVDWSSNGWIRGGYANHLVLPMSVAYTVSDQQNLITTCDYANRPAVNYQCARDVTHRFDMDGFANLSELPYAQAICLHRPGEKANGYGYPEDYKNGCPVEGRVKCLASKGGVDPTGECSKGVLSGGLCYKGSKHEQACQTNADCPGGGTCKVPCEFELWDTCRFYKGGPLTTYFRYAPMNGAQDPIHMYWNMWSKNIYPFFNVNSGNLKDHLVSKGFHAVVSTNSQLVSLNGSEATSCANAKDCKFWDIAELNPTTGALQAKNSLVAGRPNGIASYQNDFYGSIGNAFYCASGSTLYRAFTTNAECTAGCVGIPGASCVEFKPFSDPNQYIIQSQANY
jgi:cysteine-rich repeat protein